MSGDSSPPTRDAWSALQAPQDIERAVDRLAAFGSARSELVATFANLRFEWIPGHAGITENERCDALARAAIRAARSLVGPGQPNAVVHR